MTVGSLFSGIGGLDLGLERAGFEVRWQVENDPFCLRVLEKHWPTVKRYGDIREVKGNELEPVDLICGGFPCQPVSCAGRRRAQSDDRWLWPEFIRIVRMVRPRIVLVENTPGIASAGAEQDEDGEWIEARGLALGEVLGDLASSGYDAEWDCIPAIALGAPFLRYRVFIVAYFAGPERREDDSAGIASIRFDSLPSGQESTGGSQSRASSPNVDGPRWDTARSFRPRETETTRASAILVRSDPPRTFADPHGIGSDQPRPAHEQAQRQDFAPSIFSDPDFSGLALQQEQDLLEQLAAFERDAANLDSERLETDGKSGNRSDGTLETRRNDRQQVPSAENATAYIDTEQRPRCSIQTGRQCVTREPEEQIRGFGWWAAEPGVVRMVSGVPHRVDRIKALGNAVVPQIAEWLGRRILEFRP